MTSLKGSEIIFSKKINVNKVAANFCVDSPRTQSYFKPEIRQRSQATALSCSIDIRLQGQIKHCLKLFTLFTKCNRLCQM